MHWWYQLAYIFSKEFLDLNQHFVIQNGNPPRAPTFFYSAGLLLTKIEVTQFIPFRSASLYKPKNLLRVVLQKFCITDPFFTKNQEMNLKPKNLYSPDYNLLFNITTIPSKAFVVFIDEFVGGIPHQVLLFDSQPLRGLLLVLVLFNGLPLRCSSLILVLFDGLSLRGSSLILVCHALTLCTYQFTVNFVITFCIPFTVPIFTWISLPGTFSSFKTQITLIAHSWA